MKEPNTHDARAKFWEEHIRSWLEGRGYKTQESYCKEHGLSKSAFSKWKNRLYPKIQRSKHPTKTAQYWESCIKSWQKGSMSQAEYCNLYRLSESDFSKWKNKLYPELKGHRKRTKQKNRYFESSKLSNEQVEILIRGFLSDKSASELSSRANISIKSCYKYLDHIGWYFGKGATEYPQLFFGAGMLLFFGPPPHIHKYLKENYGGNKKKIGKRKLSRIIKETIIYHSHYKMSVAESWYFYFYGWLFYYQKVYSKEHGLDPHGWNLHHQKFMQAERSVGQAINELWAHYFTHDMEEIITKVTWDAIYHDHVCDNSRKYKNSMFRDLKWVILNHDPLRRNTYWDDFKPSSEELRMVQEKIDGYFDKHFEKYFK